MPLPQQTPVYPDLVFQTNFSIFKAGDCSFIVVTDLTPYGVQANMNLRNFGYYYSEVKHPDGEITVRKDVVDYSAILNNAPQYYFQEQGLEYIGLYRVKLCAFPVPTATPFFCVYGYTMYLESEDKLVMCVNKDGATFDIETWSPRYGDFKYIELKDVPSNYCKEIGAFFPGNVSAGCNIAHCLSPIVKAGACAVKEYKNDYSQLCKDERWINALRAINLWRNITDNFDETVPIEGEYLEQLSALSDELHRVCKCKRQ